MIVDERSSHPHRPKKCSAGISVACQQKSGLLASKGGPKRRDIAATAKSGQVTRRSGLALSNGEQLATLSLRPTKQKFRPKILSKSGATSGGVCPSSFQDRAAMDLISLTLVTTTGGSGFAC